MLRQTAIARGHATSNIFAPPFSGRWFNPPHQWTMTDTFLPFFIVGFSPMAIAVYLYHAAYMPHYSHFQDQNYYASQHDDSGATCSVCGHFDFLPLTCVRCHAVLCGEHIRDHPVPSTRRQCVAESAAAPAPPAPPPAPAHHCATCGSGLCVLTPCPACLRDYCAAHRFHGHEAPVRHAVSPVAAQALPLPPQAAGDMTAVCAAFVPRAPLRLAPQGYRGEELAVTAVVLGADAAVASLTVAAGMSVGQLLERWQAAHAAFASPARLCHVTGSRASTGIELREIPLSALARDAAIDGRVVALVLSGGENGKENTEAKEQLEQCLFSSSATGRMRSAAARVRMQVVIEAETEMQSPADPEARGALPRLVAAESSAPCAEAPPPPPTAAANNEWPFRQPPPIDAFGTYNTRAKPFGACDVSNLRAAVVVVVFVQDTLLRAPLAPFYMALASAWPAGRVLDRAVRCVEERAAAVRPVQWRLFDVWTQRPVAGDPHALRDGDGLFLGEAFPAELRAEMQRLQQLNGRAAAAFALKRMKSCVTM